jgi:hypothetical protein
MSTETAGQLRAVMAVEANDGQIVGVVVGWVPIQVM